MNPPDHNVGDSASGLDDDLLDPTDPRRRMGLAIAAGTLAVAAVGFVVIMCAYMVYALGIRGWWLNAIGWVSAVALIGGLVVALAAFTAATAGPFCRRLIRWVHER